MSKLEIEGIGVLDVWECRVGGEDRLYRRPSVAAQSSIDRGIPACDWPGLRAFLIGSRSVFCLLWLSLLGVGLRGCTRGSRSLLFLALRRWLVGANTAMAMSQLSYFAHSEGWLERLERLSYFSPSGSAVVQSGSGDAHAHGGLHGGLRFAA